MVASELFTAEDREEIAKAISKAEKKTAGEIVPIVASASDRYDRAEDIFGLVVAGVAVTLAWIFLQHVAPSTDAWSSEPEIALGLVPLLVIFFGAWTVGTIVADKVPPLRKLFAGRWMMQPRVEAAAAEAFARLHVRHTKGGTGIVIYVSLFEHIVCVEADKAIAEKVEASEWKSICEGMVKAMKAKKHREGFVEAIGKCGDLLSKHFPIQSDDVDELTNELRIID